MSTYTIDTATSRATPTPAPGKRLTAPAILARKGGEPIVCLTAYDAPMAGLLDPHCDVLLVGDSTDDQHAARAVGVKFAAVVAENRIAASGRFAMRDLRPLVPLVDSLNAGRRLFA